jgi:hypothetical protein
VDEEVRDVIDALVGAIRASYFDLKNTGPS